MATLDERRMELDRIKNELNSANNLYSQYVGGENEIGGLVKEKMKAGYGYDKDLITQENSLIKQQTDTPSTYAADMQQGGRFANNPILAGQASVQAQSAIQQRLDDIRGVKANRNGTIGDIVDSVTGAYKAKTAKLDAVADAKKTEYGMAEGQYKQQYDEEEDARQAAESKKKAAESKKQFDADMAYKYAALNKSGGGGGGSTSDGTVTDADIKGSMRAAVSGGMGWGELAGKMQGKGINLVKSSDYDIYLKYLYGSKEKNPYKYMDKKEQDLAKKISY